MNPIEVYERLFYSADREHEIMNGLLDGRAVEIDGEKHAFVVEVWWRSEIDCDMQTDACLAVLTHRGRSYGFPVFWYRGHGQVVSEPYEVVAHPVTTIEWRRKK